MLYFIFCFLLAKLAIFFQLTQYFRINYSIEPLFITNSTPKIATIGCIRVTKSAWYFYSTRFPLQATPYGCIFTAIVSNRKHGHFIYGLSSVIVRVTSWSLGGQKYRSCFIEISLISDKNQDGHFFFAWKRGENRDFSGGKNGDCRKFVTKWQKWQCHLRENRSLYYIYYN